jgi:hypothetical protein
VLQAALSEVIAAGRAVWHHREEVEAIERPIQVDVRLLIALMRQKQADREIFAALLDGYGKLITCEFEDFTTTLARRDEAGRLDARGTIFAKIAAFLGIEPAFRHPDAMRKVVQSPYREIVANFDQVVKSVGRTEFRSWLDTIR